MTEPESPNTAHRAAQIQTAPELVSTQHDAEIIAGEPDPIVVPERIYPWPSSVPREAHGNIGTNKTRLFNFALRQLRRLRSEFEWIPILKDGPNELNALARLPDLLKSLEQLFEDQLSSKFNAAQLALLMEADCVLICFDPSRDSIISYGSARFSPANSIPSVNCPVTHGGHMIVADGFERRQIAPLTAATMAFYGHRLLHMLKKEIIVLRTNNRFMERLMRRVEPVYRSDLLDVNDSDPDVQQVVEAIRWTDKHVFHFDEGFSFGEPTKITHRFKDDATIDGLAVDEIIYLARISSLGYFLFRLVAGVRK